MTASAGGKARSGSLSISMELMRHVDDNRSVTEVRKCGSKEDGIITGAAHGN
jgi:hypothetical protein